ncbi:AbrB/MazE/SpoVT family DNA-binding domain-containing protein [Pasteurellaceae bacterium 22721_9_1]
MSASLTISKWGNSTAIRLPKTLLAKFNLSEGDSLRLVTSSDLSRLVFEPVYKAQVVEEKTLSEKDWELICELLDNPPAPNERLKKAALALKESYNEF